MLTKMEKVVKIKNSTILKNAKKKWSGVNSLDGFWKKGFMFGISSANTVKQS